MHVTLGAIKKNGKEKFINFILKVLSFFHWHKMHVPNFTVMNKLLLTNDRDQITN